MGDLLVTFADATAHWCETSRQLEEAFGKLAAHEGDRMEMVIYVTRLLRQYRDVILPQAFRLLNRLQGQTDRLSDKATQSALRRELAQSERARQNTAQALQLIA